jgi:hypothetical protein
MNAQMGREESIERRMRAVDPGPWPLKKTLQRLKG